MELSKNVLLVKVAVLLFLMGLFSATAEAGRLDPTFIISQVLNNGDDAAAYMIPKASTKDCCDSCICDVPYPEVWCRCTDVAESCHPSCAAGACKCTKSDPPQCQCWEYAKGKCPIAVCS